MNVPARLQELSTTGLSVRSSAGPIVSDVEFSLSPGVPLTLLGESGSGKSLVAQAVMGTLPPELEASGAVRLNGTDLLAAAPGDRRRLWGRGISLLPQEPWLALDPTMKVGEQVAEVHRFVHRRGAAESTARAQENLAAVGLGPAAALYPFQLSGGMCQRAAVAIAHAGDCGLMIADEPTKGLDAQLRDHVVARLKQEVDAGRLVFTITHDIGVARALGGKVGIMLEGRLVDYGPAAEVLANPTHDYSRALLQADPETWPQRAPRRTGATVLAGRGLAKSFGERHLFEGLDIEVGAGEIVCIVGPSGCGKTSVGNILLGLLAPDAGQVEQRSGIAPLRYQKLYQDPPAAFAPHQALRKGLEDLARLHRLSWHQVERLLARLKLPQTLLDRLPGQISGGELQRLAILRALLLKPAFLFADEATSRLDPLSQKEVIDLLLEIVGESGLAILLVTHDHALAEKVASRTVVLGQ
ncbi:MAG: ATP-binding cassette domain-containing protein [Kiloniellaceae bacterium]